MNSIRLFTIAILKSPVNTLTNTDKYLQSAGAIVHSFTKPAEFIEHISKESPDCVFICTDFPAEQIQNSVYLITHVLKLPIFGFTKSLSYSSLQLLETLPFEEINKGDVTGPYIEKTIINFFAQKAEESKKQATEAVQFQKQIYDVQNYNKQTQRNLVDSKTVKLEIEQAKYSFGKSANVSDESQKQSNIFLNVIKDTVAEIKTVQDETLVDDQLSYEISEINLFEFKVDQMRFYFILANLDDKPFSNTDVEKFIKIFKKNLFASEEKSEIGEQLQITIPRSRVREWLTDKGYSFTLTSLWKRPCYLGIVANVGLDSFHVKKSSDSEFLEIPLTSIPMNVPLSYEVYILLTMNQKFFPYLTKGKLVTSKTISKLSAQKINSVYIAKAELSSYLQRLAFKNITETLFGYLSKHGK